MKKQTGKKGSGIQIFFAFTAILLIILFMLLGIGVIP